MTDSLAPFIDSDVILYDLSRLVVRRNEPFATGIDRIDLAFAKDLLERRGDQIQFVLLNGRDGLLLEQKIADDLLAKLEHIWMGETSPERSSWFNDPFARKKTMAWLARMVRPTSALLPRLSKLLDGKSATYIVASHHGLPRAPNLLRRLREMCDLQVYAYMHDLIPVRYPEYIRPNQIGKLERYLEQLRLADARLFANSAHSAADLEQYARDNDWPLQKVEVILPDLPPLTSKGVAPSDRIAPIRAGTKPYFVTVGTIEPRKNHLTLLQCWRHWAQVAPEQVPHLYIVGQRGWQNGEIINFLETCPAIQSHVTEFGDLDDHDLFHLLQGATGMLFPSFAEGLGLPLLEAKACGVKAIVSDLAIFRSFAAESTRFVNPADGLAWLRACEDLIKTHKEEQNCP